VEVNSSNLGGGHVCWGSYDGFNFAGWCGCCGFTHPQVESAMPAFTHQRQNIIILQMAP